MKNAYMNGDSTVREILPSEISFDSISEWYNEEFASHCMEVPDYVEPNWEYDSSSNQWYEPGRRPDTTLLTAMKAEVDAI